MITDRFGDDRDRVLDLETNALIETSSVVQMGRCHRRDQIEIDGSRNRRANEQTWMKNKDGFGWRDRWFTMREQT